METHKQHPIGVYPKWLAKEIRLQELLEAIARYEEAELPVSLEWQKEVLEIKLWLIRREIKKQYQTIL